MLAALALTACLICGASAAPWNPGEPVSGFSIPTLEGVLKVEGEPGADHLPLLAVALDRTDAWSKHMWTSQKSLASLLTKAPPSASFLFLSYSGQQNATEDALWMRSQLAQQAQQLGPPPQELARRLGRLHFATLAAPALDSPLPAVLSNWSTPRKLLRARLAQLPASAVSRAAKANTAREPGPLSTEDSAPSHSISSSAKASTPGAPLEVPLPAAAVLLAKEASPSKLLQVEQQVVDSMDSMESLESLESTRLDAFYGWLPWPLTGVQGPLRLAGWDCDWGISHPEASGGKGGLAGSTALVLLSRLPQPVPQPNSSGGGGRHQAPRQCSYGWMLEQAEVAGAKAVVVAAPKGAELEEMTCAGGEEEGQEGCESGREVGIPATMVTHSVGRALLRLLRRAAGGQEVLVDFVEEQGPGLFAGIGADASLFEVGWPKFPTLMHAVWAAQWQEYLGRLSARLAEPALVVPILPGGQVMEGEHGLRVTVSMPEAEVVAASRLELDMALGCQGPRDADCPVWDHVIQLFVCCSDSPVGQLPPSCDPCHPTVWGPLGGSSREASVGRHGQQEGQWSPFEEASLSESGQLGSQARPVMGSFVGKHGQQGGEELRCGRELARWITPFRRRIGRWLTDITPLRALLSGSQCTFTMQSTSWAGPWVPSLSLRLLPPPSPQRAQQAEAWGQQAEARVDQLQQQQEEGQRWQEWEEQRWQPYKLQHEKGSDPQLPLPQPQLQLPPLPLPLVAPLASWVRDAAAARSSQATQLLPLPFAGGNFDARYNSRFAPFTFPTPPGLRRALIVSLITGHGSDELGCAEFCPTSHHFEVNGALHSVEFGDAGTLWGCTDKVLEGVEPNEHGTWQYGRNGWCDGQDVKAWVADITADVAPAEGTTNTIVYYGLLHGQDPQPQQPPGYILMQSNLVLYTSSGAEAGEGPGTKGDGELTAAAAA